MQLCSNKTTPLCIMPDGKLVCYKYGDIIIFRNGIEEKRFSLLRSRKEVLLGRYKYFYRLFRLGIRAAEILVNDCILLSVGNYNYELDLQDGILSKGWYCGDGIRRLIMTAVNNIEGFDDGIYFGGYLGNRSKKPVHVYKRIGVDDWQVVYTFPQGAINHVHNIVADPYRNCLWIFTGDFDEAAAIWKVTDNFKRVERVACNDQRYRACVAFALPEGLLYATDAPFADDYIYLLKPNTNRRQTESHLSSLNVGRGAKEEDEVNGTNQTNDFEIEQLFPIHGSCIYGCQWKDKYVFSSTVEGDGRHTSRWEFYFGRKRGAGIKDDYVHMYMGNLQEGFKEIYKEKKDCMPYYTFQFGAFKFPYGVNNTDTLFFQPVATKKNDLRLMALTEKEVSD